MNARLTADHGVHGRPALIVDGRTYSPDEVLWIDGSPEIRFQAESAGYPVLSEGGQRLREAALRSERVKNDPKHWTNITKTVSLRCPSCNTEAGPQRIDDDIYVMTTCWECGSKLFHIKD
ncbi:MAG: hypothetical protein IBX71_08270 [Candidatus Desulforudis sp.]|nr:hypothetical protein [Desulforudis sp.]